MLLIFNYDFSPWALRELIWHQWAFITIHTLLTVSREAPVCPSCRKLSLWIFVILLWSDYKSFWVTASDKDQKYKCNVNGGCPCFEIQIKLRLERWRMWIPQFNTNPHVYTIRLVSTSSPPSSHQLFYDGHMRTVNTMSPLHSLAFCLYFLRQNNGYKRQSGKNKIWCKAQILVPEDLVNWPGGLVKKKQPRREGEHYYWPTSAPCMCQCFNNFLQACWPLALVLLHRTKNCPPKLVSGLYCVPPFHGKPACRDTWAELWLTVFLREMSSL